MGVYFAIGQKRVAHIGGDPLTVKEALYLFDLFATLLKTLV
jgi:hypothetical protein